MHQISRLTHLFAGLAIAGLNLKRILCCLLSFSMLSMTVVGSPVWAQAAAEVSDAQAPVIELGPSTEGNAGDIQVFNAGVTDDQGLLAILLFYRFSGEEEYNSVDMLPLEGTTFFTASVPTSEEDIRDIEYFIQAEDTAGNRSIKGFTFDPLVRKMLAPVEELEPIAVATEAEAAASEQSENVPGLSGSTGAAIDTSSELPTVKETEQGGRKRLIWGLVGLVVVAAIAVSLSDSDDDKSDDTTNPITLNTGNSQLLSIEW